MTDCFMVGGLLLHFYINLQLGIYLCIVLLVQLLVAVVHFMVILIRQGRRTWEIRKITY